MKYKTGDKFIVEIKAIPYGDGNAIYLIKSEDRELGVLTQWTLDRLEMVQEHDGCDGCEFLYAPKEDYPCFDCKNNFLDRWERKAEEIQVGDEVKNESLAGCKAVVYQVSGANLCVVREKDGKLVTTLWGKEYCTRTGKTYPELIKALAELPKEGEK